MRAEARTILSELLAVEQAVPDDSMGASPVSKCFLMCYLVEALSFKTFVEIGVYKGRSLFSVAQRLRQTGGLAIGIDPYLADSFRETDLDDTIKKAVDEAADTIHFPSLFAQVLQTRRELGLEDVVRILRMTDKEAYEPLKRDLGSGIDLLHIDGNHDTAFVDYDASHYIPLVRAGGIIVFDDTNWPSVRGVYEKYAARLPVLLETPYFSILYKPQAGRVLPEDNPPVESEGAVAVCAVPLSAPDKTVIQRFCTCLPALLDNMEAVRRRRREDEKPTLFVGVLSYNHAAYIEECLESILRQTGDFTMQLVVLDDASTDGTWRLERELQARRPEMTLLRNPANRGYVRNYVVLRRMFEESGCDYLAYVEGDDYLLSPDRMNAHIRFLEDHPECAWVFNDLVLYYQSEDRYEIHPEHPLLRQERYRAEDLAARAFVGTWSASTFRRNAMLHIPLEFTLVMASSDWLSGVLAAECGDIGHIRRPLSVYRKHSAGAWSGLREKEANYRVYELLRKFNRWTDFRYSAQNRSVMQMLSEQMDVPEEQMQKMRDLLIIDDVYPHPGSGFRLAEFTAILRRFPSARCLSNGVSAGVLDQKRSVREYIGDFLLENPDLAGQIEWFPERSYDGEHRYRLAYFCFLQNAFFALPGLERSGTPFVLELYPGGGMAFDNPEADEKLKAVFSSRCFRKVIVTQDVTEEYLLRKRLCKRTQIEKIFGVVIPRENLEHAVLPGAIVPHDRPLNICFASYRYTPTGRDKGYDVFVETAKLLHRRDAGYRFHVAGGFDASVLDVSELGNAIRFHGALSSEALRGFLAEMDILISPNRAGEIYPGAFDGFPTTSCTESMLQGTLVMTTDPLCMNNGRYQPEREIEIIDADSGRIAQRVAWYDAHRPELAAVCRAQLAKTMELYSAEAQIAPRIRLLEQEIGKFSFRRQR